MDKEHQACCPPGDPRQATNQKQLDINSCSFESYFITLSLSRNGKAYHLHGELVTDVTGFWVMDSEANNRSKLEVYFINVCACAQMHTCVWLVWLRFAICFQLLLFIELRT